MIRINIIIKDKQVRKKKLLFLHSFTMALSTQLIEVEKEERTYFSEVSKRIRIPYCFCCGSFSIDFSEIYYE